MLNNDDRNKLESQVLNSLLTSKTYFYEVYDFNPNVDDLFVNPHNRLIYDTIMEYYVERDCPTTHEVFNEMILKNYSIDTKNHFTKNISSAEVCLNIQIIYKLLEDSIERLIKTSLNQIEKRKLIGLEYAESIRETVDQVILNKFENYRRDVRSNEEKVYDLLNDIKNIREGKHTDYLPTGFERLDNAVIGIPKAHLTTIAARPGMGKTSFMLQLKRNLVDKGYKPLIISIEMTTDQLMIKDLSALTDIDSKKIETGNLTDTELQSINKKAKIICKENYFIEDDGNQTIEKIKSTIRRYLIKHSTDIIFIDYLTLIQIENNKNRYDLEIGKLTNDFRELAKETSLPIVILSQLNRECEKRIDRRPQLSDLRESGSIEQDSKLVMFLYRPDYYGLNPFESGASYNTCDGQILNKEEYLELIIGKCRNGNIGKVAIRYIPHLHKFESVTRHNKANHSNISTDNWYENTI